MNNSGNHGRKLSDEQDGLQAIWLNALSSLESFEEPDVSPELRSRIKAALEQERQVAPKQRRFPLYRLIGPAAAAVLILAMVIPALMTRDSRRDMMPLQVTAAKTVPGSFALQERNGKAADRETVADEAAGEKIINLETSFAKIQDDAAGQADTDQSRKLSGEEEAMPAEVELSAGAAVPEAPNSAPGQGPDEAKQASAVQDTAATTAPEQYAFEAAPDTNLSESYRFLLPDDSVLIAVISKTDDGAQETGTVKEAGGLTFEESAAGDMLPEGEQLMALSSFELEKYVKSLSLLEKSRLKALQHKAKAGGLHINYFISND